MRATASMVAKTGTTVQATALNSESHNTGAGCNSAAAGRMTLNCRSRPKPATHIAYEVRRIAPMRATSSPATTRYTA
jgi:hypothetical protein